MALGGNVADPTLAGTLALAGGSFSGPMLTSQVTDGVARLTFAGKSVRLHDASAKVGGGTIVPNGSAAVSSMRHPSRTAPLTT